MANDWVEVQLQDVVTKLGDGLHGTPKYSENGEYYFINGNNLENGQIVFKEQTKRVDHTQYLKHKKELNERTLLVSINGTIGNVAYYSGEKVVLGKSACYFNLKDDIDKGYVRYVLSGHYFQSYINAFATGTTIKNVSLKSMREFSFQIPTFPEQKAIAHILGSLDDKIELNRQMNETLEAMAQALFKSWFIDFDPVIDNALAVGNDIPDELFERAEQRKGIEKQDKLDIQGLFPDTFEFTEEMGWIPKGWEVRKLKSICRVLNGRAYKNTEFKEQGTPIVRIQNLSRSGKTVYSDLDLPEDKIICTEDFLYAWSATFGPHIWRGPKSIYHYHIWKMDVDENIVSRYFLYLAMFRKTESMKNAGTGSIFTHLTKKIMEGQDILIGDEKVNTAFSNQVTVIFKKITKLDEENNFLSEIRDTLLPKLMSGELRISDAAALVDEVI